MKCYRFSVDKWSRQGMAADNRKILRDWCIKNDYQKTPLYVADDVYIYSRDKSELHMVITGSKWDDLPPVLSKYGEDIFEYLLDCIVDETTPDVEEEFLNHILN